MPAKPTLAPAARMTLLAVLALAAVGAYMLVGANGNWSFVLPYRSVKLAAMLLVAFAIAVSSVLFQSITHNRILTPSVMGFDALYVLIQALVILVLGMSQRGADGGALRFAVEVALMTGFACLLFRRVFTGAAHSLHLMLLTGVVFGLLFRSLSGFVVRLIDPNEFASVQGRMFASFGAVQTGLWAAALAVGGAAVMAWRLRYRYDVLALGRDTALSLGIDYRRTVMWTLVVVSVMVAVSTALVGPVLFFGLLISNLAYVTMGSDRHRWEVPAAVLWGVVFLVGGQALIERIFKLDTTVGILIELLGGLLFLLLVTRKKQT